MQNRQEVSCSFDYGIMRGGRNVMLIKEPDDKSKRLKLLRELQKSDRLETHQKNWLRDELRKLQPGVTGERDAAHYLDLSFSDSKNHAVLHDLRLEADDQSAQIDHLVVDRTLAFFLLETKTYNGSLHINDRGEFMVEYADEKKYGIESPIEQSRRHETVLKKVLERVGITGRMGTKPTFHHIVMVHPKAIIHRPDSKVFDTSSVIKADQFATWHKKFVDKLSGLSMVAGMLNTRSRDTVLEWGELLKAEHRPTNPLELPDFMKPKRLPAQQESAVAPTATEDEIRPPQTSAVCFTCGKPLTEKVVKFCKDQSARFGGKLYCYNHQLSNRAK